VKAKPDTKKSDVKETIKKSDKKNVKKPYRKVINDKSIGVIVFRYENEQIKFLLIKHSAGHWAFPKGHPDKGESKIQTAKRELLEETGIKDVTLISDKILLDDKYMFTGSKKELISKIVYYFIAVTKNDVVKIDEDEIIDFKWCTLEESMNYLFHKETIILINKAYKIIYEYNHEKIS